MAKRKAPRRPPQPLRARQASPWPPLRRPRVSVWKADRHVTFTRSQQRELERHDTRGTQKARALGKKRQQRLREHLAAVRAAWPPEWLDRLNGAPVSWDSDPLAPFWQANVETLQRVFWFAGRAGSWTHPRVYAAIRDAEQTWKAWQRWAPPPLGCSLEQVEAVIAEGRRWLLEAQPLSPLPLTRLQRCKHRACRAPWFFDSTPGRSQFYCSAACRMAEGRRPLREFHTRGTGDRPALDPGNPLSRVRLRFPTRPK